MLCFLSLKSNDLQSGGAEKNSKLIYFVTWTVPLILCLFLFKKKCLELVFVIYSSFKLIIV